MPHNWDYPSTTEKVNEDPQNHKEGCLGKSFWGGIGAIAAIAALIVAIISIPQAALIRQGISQTFSGTPAATAPPTATPSPTSTPSPTPTLITITKNLDIPYNLCCGIKIDLKLTTIVIDTSKQTSTWSFTLTNNGNYINGIHFTTLVLEDNTGQKHQGGGLASTDSWNMSSGQSIQTYATFDVVHGTNYLLNIAIEYGTYQTETITF